MNLRKIKFYTKDEPLYEIIKARTINIGKIKDKEERKYWRELKRINEIPQIYLSNNEIDSRLKERYAKIKGEFKMEKDLLKFNKN